jgi:hypothetical protein
MQLAARSKDLVNAERAKGFSEEKIWAIGDQELAQVAQRITLGRVEDSKRDVKLTDDQLRALAPSTLLVASMLMAIARATIMQPTSPRRPKVSDAGDLLHAVYLPHVDLYRTDAFAGDQLARIAPEYAGRIVRSFAELPDRVEAALLQRRS